MKVTTQGDTVEGEFKNEVKYPDEQGGGGQELPDAAAVVRDLQLQQPAAGAAGLQEGRDQRDADQRRARVLHVPAARVRPGDPARVPVHLAVQAGGRRADGRDRLVRPLARASRGRQRDEDHVQRRGGHRRVQGRARRGRRLPQEPREVPEARRPDSARRAARGPAGHGQDAARARGRGRSGRPVLQHLRLRVRRGHRRHRRLARARPVQAGQGSRAGDHLHRRARRDRPPALVRRRPVLRRQRRARADAQPDPHGDGRVRAGRHRDRGRRDQPRRDPRFRAAASRAASTAG